jgi:hypothetical protein
MKSALRLVSALSLSLAITLVVGPAVTTFADDINPGVFAIDSQPYGLTYGQWSEKWWQWALSVPNQPSAFDGCPNESGPVWFLSGVSPQNSGTCSVPAGKAIMFPTFNAEWSVAEANAAGGVCPVPGTMPNGTSYAALFACAQAFSGFATQPGAKLQADVDGQKLQNLLDYRAHSDPPPFPFNATSGNIFGVPAGQSSAVADGFWIMLSPLSPGSHTIHFAAKVRFPVFRFTFSDDATFNLVVP